MPRQDRPQAKTPGHSAPSKQAPGGQRQGGTWQGQKLGELKGQSLNEQMGALSPDSGGGGAVALPKVSLHPGLIQFKTGDFSVAPKEEQPENPMLFGWLFGKGKKGGKGSGKKKESAKEKPTDISKAQVEGIASSVAIGRFVKAAKGVQKDWSTLGSAKARAKKIGGAANAELAAVKVPETSIHVKAMPTSAGQFDFSTWGLDLNTNLFKQASITKGEAATVADTVYHEARHCEQWHRMARLEAGKGKKADDLVTEMFIPKAIADDAVARPLKAESKEGKEAETWYQSVYGAKSGQRNTTLTDVHSKATELETAVADYNKLADEYDAQMNDPKATKEAQEQALKKAQDAHAAYQKANEAFDKAYKAYRALPEEVDAWKTGGDVETAYLK